MKRGIQTVLLASLFFAIHCVTTVPGIEVGVGFQIPPATAFVMTPAGRVIPESALVSVSGVELVACDDINANAMLMMGIARAHHQSADETLDLAHSVGGVHEVVVLDVPPGAYCDLRLEIAALDSQGASLRFVGSVDGERVDVSATESLLLNYPLPTRFEATEPVQATITLPVHLSKWLREWSELGFEESMLAQAFRRHMQSEQTASIELDSRN